MQLKLYADLATENSNIKVKEKNVEVLKRQFELTKEQFEIGEVTLTDVSISDARFSLAESELMETSNIINSLEAKYLSIFGKIQLSQKLKFLQIVKNLILRI